MQFKQGDIVLVDLNPVIGYEQAEKRPVVVLQTSKIHVMGGTVIVAPITSKLKTHPLQVTLDQRTRTQGVVLCTQIRALDLRKRNAYYLEAMPFDILEECCDIVRQLMELD